jgi:hypothetical protein
MSLTHLERREAVVPMLLLLFGVLLSMENLSLFALFNLFLMPPLAALCVVGMTFLWIRFRVGNELALPLGLFLAWCVCVSLVGLLIDTLVYAAPDQRLIAFVKQGLALAAGLCIYGAARLAFTGRSTKMIMRAWLYGGTPSLVLGLALASGTLAGSQPIADAVGWIRGAVLGPNIAGTELGRTSGLSNEPAHFGAYLMLVVFPAVLILMSDPERRNSQRVFGLAVAAAVCFFMTFSMTSFVVCGAMLLTASLAWRDIGIGLKVSLVAGPVISACALFLLFPENYLSGQISELFNEDLEGVSWIPKIGSTLGPLINMVDTLNPLGYGLGSTTFRINDILPSYMIAPIAAVSYETELNLKGLTGRLLAETGIPGVLLFAWVFIRAARVSVRVDKSLTRVNAMVLMGLFVAMSCGNIGSLAHPIVWVWLALWDSRKPVPASVPLGADSQQTQRALPRSG